MNKDIFKAYDIRGIYPTEINADDVKKIAMAYAAWLKPKKVALGRDVRSSGAELWQAACDGLIEMGVDVVDVGVISTDMLYFVVANYELDGGITLSASHNEGKYNGMKMVRAKAAPISMDSGIAEIRELAMANTFEPATKQGTVEKLDFMSGYTAKNVSFADRRLVKPLKVVVNPNFGASGVAISAIAEHFGLQLTKINFEPDGSFPKGKPDHSQPENRTETTALIKAGDYDLGVTWDADADRCGFYDEKGEYIFPYYATGLMIDYFLEKQPDAKVVVDSCYYWLPQALVDKTGGKLIVCKTGYSYVTQSMIDNDALFGAEIAGHYYFKDFWLADNGMIPFVIMLQILSQSDKPLSELIAKYKNMVYALPVTNFVVKDVVASINTVKTHYQDGQITELDGFSVEYPDWRFNVRPSNTEPLLRLSLEGKSKELVEAKLAELTGVIGGEKA